MRKFKDIELQVLVLIADGLTDNEIGKEINISASYVRRIIENLFNKSGAINKAHLVSWAYRNNILGG